MWIRAWKLQITNHVDEIGWEIVWNYGNNVKKAYLYQINDKILQILAIFRDFRDIFAITVKLHKTPRNHFFWEKMIKKCT
jgi:hypothetical protein